MSISPERLNDIKTIPNSEIDTPEIPEFNDEFRHEAQLKMPQTPQPLSELLAQVDEELETEIDWGSPMGKEVW